MTCRISARPNEQLSGYVGARARILWKSCSPSRQSGPVYSVRQKRGLLWSAQLSRGVFHIDPNAGKHRISCEQAILFIGNIRERLSVTSLDGDEYARALEASAAQGIIGGGIYDAMLAHCALKASAEVIYTWNECHYALCGADVGAKLRTP